MDEDLNEALKALSDRMHDICDLMGNGMNTLETLMIIDTAFDDAKEVIALVIKAMTLRGQTNHLNN